jgi:hypothetical protein
MYGFNRWCVMVSINEYRSIKIMKSSNVYNAMETENLASTARKFGWLQIGL